MKKLINRNRLFYITIFCFFFLILTLSPISGDDWGNYLVGKIGLRHCFGQALGMYFTWEGRLVSRILINLLTYHKWLWNIVNSICITGIIYMMMKLIKPKHKITVLCLSILSILLMNIYTFSQIIVWIAGNITYLFPIALILFYILDLKNHKEMTKIKVFIMTIFQIIVPMFVEHMAVLFILINLSVLLIKYYQTKKWDKTYLMYTAISIISTLAMFLSPGTKIRSNMENLEFNQLNIFHKVFYNIPNFIYYTFIVNSYLLCLLSISNSYRIYNLKIDKSKKIFLFLYLLVIPIITVIIYNLSLFINLPSFFLELINPSNIVIIIFWLSYLLLYFYLQLKDSKTKQGKLNLVFSLLGILSNAIMLLSPTWGYRTSLATYLFLVIPQIEVIDRMNMNKLLEKLLVIITVIVSLVWFIFYINIRLAQNELEKSIQKQLSEDKEVIEVISFPSYANCNINPINDYHLSKFKEYYSIPSDKEVKLLPNNWRYIIIK